MTYAVIGGQIAEIVKRNKGYAHSTAAARCLAIKYPYLEAEVVFAVEQVRRAVSSVVVVVVVVVPIVPLLSSVVFFFKGGGSWFVWLVSFRALLSLLLLFRLFRFSLRWC